MNIFDLYLDKIINIIKKAKADGVLALPENLNAINVDIPPQQFDCDISTNVAMVLSKLNNKSSVELANQLIKLINKDNNIEDISIAQPGFINIKFKSNFWNKFLEEIIINNNTYGINQKEKKEKIFN